MTKEEGNDLVNLDHMIADLDNTNSSFLNVFSNKVLDMGILRIKVGEKDTQLPHSVDEAYFVVKGNGSIEIDGNMKPVRSSDFVFVPAEANHRFIADDQDLVVIYFFPS
jgi:mannose-6-phosphate isomerase-like protein (cupin superfamily)